MDSNLVEVKKRFIKEFDNIYIEDNIIIIQDYFNNAYCKNDNDCYSHALDNATIIREMFPEMELVDYYCHKHKYAICELRFSKEYLDSKNDKKPLEKWQELDNFGLNVIDDDGWDKDSYQFFFYDELITYEEYERRKMFLTYLNNKK